jgi:ATP-binding cassette subfamily B protein
MEKKKKNKKKEEEVTVISQIKALRNIPRFCRLIWELSPRLTLLNILVRSVQAVLPVSILYVGKEIIDEVVELAKEGTSAEKFWNSDVLIFWIFTGLGIAILLNIFTRISSLTDTLLANWVNNETSMKLMLQASSLDLYHFEDPDFYNNLSRARTDTRSRTLLINLILTQIQDFITLIALLAALLVFSPSLVFFLILVVVPTFLTESFFNKKIYKLTRDWTPEMREKNYLRLIGTEDRVAKEIKVFGLEKFITNRFIKLATNYYYASKKILINRALIGSLLNIVTITTYYGAYVYVLYQTVAGILTIGMMTFLGGAFQRMQNILQTTANRFSRLAAIGLYLEDFFYFMDMQLPAKEAGTKVEVPDSIQSEIVFENVSFKYFGSEQYAIKNLNFTLKAGESLALVGENGAGKTTFVKLLARLYEPTEGRILWDGIDIQDFDYEEYRTKIGVIFQDFVKFMFTAKENIFVGNIAEKDNQALIEKAAKKSLADTVINQLDNKYDQMLGKRFEGGVELSGGQWQKIALSRAYMRNADLVILDEPTSALDARAEHEVFLRFSELMKGKTAILISHRFSTVRMASKILFLEYGQVLEHGTHQELIAKEGKYAELFDLQAQGYL